MESLQLLSDIGVSMCLDVSYAKRSEMFGGLLAHEL